MWKFFNLPTLFISFREVTNLTFLVLISLYAKATPMTLAVWLFCQVIGSFFQGKISDVTSRKWMLVVSFFFSSIAYLILVFAQEYIMIAFIIDGCLGNTTALARAAYIDIYPKMEKRKLIAVSTIYQGIPWFIFPIVSLFTIRGHGYWRITCFVFLMLGLLLSLFAFWDRQDYRLMQKKRNPFPLNNRFVIYGLSAFFLVYLGFEAMVYYIEEGASVTDLSRSYGLLGVGLLLGGVFQLLIRKSPLSLKRFLVWTFMAAFLIFTLKFASYSWELSDKLFDFSMQTDHAFITGFYLPLIFAYFTDRAQIHQQGEICGILESIQSASEFVAPLFSSLMLLVSISLSFAFIGLLFLLGAYLININAPYPQLKSKSRK